MSKILANGGWWQLGLIGLVVSSVASTTNPAFAQLTPDTTMPGENSTVTSGVVVGGYCCGDRIDGGATRGSNLFHSFLDFNVGASQSVYFANPAGIQNIITRVTGNNPSNILGELGVDGGNANLFLINPKGIIFGSNTQLYIQGSFIASTANSVVFPNGYQFSATNPQAPPLLTINVPIGLQFGANPGDILVQGDPPPVPGAFPSFSSLIVPFGTLALVGGNVTLDKGALLSNERIEVGSVAGNSLVKLSPIAQSWALGYEEVQKFQDILMTDSIIQSINPFSSSGNTLVRGQHVKLTGHTEIAATTLGGGGNAGNISVIATESVELRGRETGLFSDVYPSATGNGGNLNIETRQLTIADGALLSARSYGSGKGGNINLEIENLSSSGYSAILTEALSTGNAGNVIINTNNLILRDGSVVSAGTRGSGQGGNITVNAIEFVELTGTEENGRSPSGLFASSLLANAGNAGNINIATKKITIRDGAGIGTSTVGRGQAGDIKVKARDFIELIGISPSGQSLTNISTRTTDSGNAGDITILTPKFTIRDGAVVVADTSGAGHGGNVIVENADSVELIGTSETQNPSSFVPSRIVISARNSGNAGNLNINTRNLTIRDGASVFADTSSFGQAGTLVVNASESVQIIGTSGNGKVSSSLFFDSSGAGNAGELRIDTKKLLLQNGGRVSASTSGTGEGGIIAVNASDFVQINGTNGQFASGLYFDSRGAGNARGISINTGNLNVENGGLVTVSGSGSGVAGDINVTAGSIFLNEQGKIRAETISGEGGNIHLQVNDSLVLRHNSEISTEAKGTGNGGNITIRAGNFIWAVLSENSDVVGNAFKGKGGNINLNGTAVLGFRQFNKVRSPESDLTASSALNIDGTVTINAQTSVQPNILPSKLLTTLVDGRCQVGYQRRSHNSFEITNTNNLPLGYNHETNSSEVDLRMSEAKGEKSDRPAETLQESPLSPGQNTSNPNQLIEAQGFIVTPEGKVKLVETAPTTTLYPPPPSAQTCAAQQANSNH